jgi:Fe-S cluster biogenesis protein NfuA
MNREAIEKVINEKIRPALAADGGGIELINVNDDNSVEVKLTGACGTCPFSQMTLKAGVETALKEEFPEIKEVISV